MSSQQALVRLEYPEDHPLRSESPEARNVAGYVSRRTDRTSQAEAPPSRTPNVSSKNSKETRKGKGKQSDNFDGDEGSDSDEDRSGSHQNDIDAGMVFTPRSPTPRSLVPNFPTFNHALSTSYFIHRTYPYLDPYYEHGPTMHQKAEVWRRCKDFRRQQREWKFLRVEREELLLKNIRPERSTSKAAGEMAFAICLRRARGDEEMLQTFKKKIKLFLPAVPSSEKQQTVANSEMTKEQESMYRSFTRCRVEQGLIKRCLGYGKMTKGYPTFFGPDLLQVAEALYRAIWFEVPQTKASRVQDLPALVQEFIDGYLPADYFRRAKLDGELVEQYVDGVCTSLVEDIISAHKAGRPCNPWGARLIKTISNFRGGIENVQEYPAWVFSVLKLEDFSRKVWMLHNILWTQLVEKEKFEKVQKRHSGELVFLQKGLRRDVDDVFVAVLEADVPIIVRTVLPEELEGIGWHRDTPWDLYWRYEFGRNKLANSADESEVLFKVRMDGEVIGVRTADGKLDWHDSLKKVLMLSLQTEQVLQLPGRQVLQMNE